MKKDEWLDKAASGPEERQMLARLWDLWQRCEQRGCVTTSHFLDAHQGQLARRAFERLYVERLVLAGGYPQADRCMAVFYPDYLTGEQAASELPIRAMEAKIRGEETLTHRDYLGALLSNGIKREAVGDILVHEDRAQIILSREVTDFVLQQWEQAGRRKLDCRPIDLEELQPPRQEFSLITDTVSALRLDSVVASGFALSRGEAKKWIESGRAAVNHCPCDKCDGKVEQGDIISLRGKGKIQLSEVGGQSRKGRLFLKIKKYL